MCITRAHALSIFVLTLAEHVIIAGAFPEEPEPNPAAGLTPVDYLPNGLFPEEPEPNPAAGLKPVE
jgi:hypothetical protein